MASLYTHQSENVFKTWLLMAVFFVIIIFLGWFLSRYYGNPGILYAFFIFSVVMNIASYWWSDKIVLAMSGAKPASREEFFDLYTVTENLSITAGLPMPKLYVINDPAPNAFATGRNKEHGVVAVTTGLLGMLNRSELEGVIAHELSHVGNRDILVMTVAVVLVGFVSMVAIILAPIAAQLIQLAISRKREFLADASGALLTRYPDGLASALQKIGSYSAPMRRASTTTAHLFISNPFGTHQAGQFLQKLFSTHPPVQERIAALHGMNV